MISEFRGKSQFRLALLLEEADRKCVTFIATDWDLCYVCTVSASILTSFDANHALFTPPAGAPVTRAAALERLVGAPRGTASLGQVGGVVALDVNKVLSVVWRSKGASSAVQESQAIVLANEHHLPYFMFGGRPTVGGTLTLFYNAFSRGF